MARYDVIVVGLGAHGSAAAYHLAKWGSKVLGLDRWAPGHSNGSHHGETRITRQAYAEGAAYVPLLKYSFDAYATLEREAKRRLFVRTGCLNVGAPMADAAGAAAAAHGLPHERLTSAELMRRFPGVSVPAGTPALYEAAGGALLPEAMVAAHVEVARYHGATIDTDARVTAWEPTRGGGVRVATEGGREYEADRLVLAPGAWVGKLVPGLAGLVAPQRVTVAWFDPLRPRDYAPPALPVWLLQERPEDHALYGFPTIAEAATPGFKIGVFGSFGPSRGGGGGGGANSGGSTGDSAGAGADAAAAPFDPDTPDRSWRGAADEAPLRAAVERYFPGAAGALVKGGVCMFTHTPDGHFAVDLHPRHPQVVLASACSGHGFKLSPAVGLALAELARHGRCVTFPHEMKLHALDGARGPAFAAAVERLRNDG